MISERLFLYLESFYGNVRLMVKLPLLGESTFWLSWTFNRFGLVNL